MRHRIRALYFAHTRRKLSVPLSSSENENVGKNSRTCLDTLYVGFALCTVHVDIFIKLIEARSLFFNAVVIARLLVTYICAVELRCCCAAIDQNRETQN